LTISAFFLFFFFRDGPIIFKKATNYIPFSRKETTIILRELKVMADAVIYGQLITAMVQATLATIAYTVIGVNTPLVWGVLTMILSLIPMVGPAFVYIPLSASFILSGLAASDGGMIFRGILLLVIGMGIVSSVDNFIKPLLISDRTRMHPALVLIGVVGGLTQFGVIGIIIGPLILVVLFTFFKIFAMKIDIFEGLKERKV
jgi:predicted PurR-regulated permease PerM